MNPSDLDLLCAIASPEGTKRQQLTQLCADLQARPWRSHWVLMILLLIATFVADYAIGLYRLAQH